MYVEKIESREHSDVRAFGDLVYSSGFGLPISQVRNGGKLNTVSDYRGQSSPTSISSWAIMLPERQRSCRQLRSRPWVLRAREAKLPHRRMVRSYPVGESANKHRHADSAFILAKFYRHEPETMASDPSDPDLEDELFESMQEFERRGELESMEWAGIDSGSWAMAYESTNSAFFCAAYGSNRRVESAEYPELGMRDKLGFTRAQRVLSVFQDGYPLYRLANWLPRIRKANTSRYEELSELLRRLTGPGHFQFTGLLHEREYDFERSGTSIPFPALSDGYRGFIGWVGDLLYHMNYASQNERSLADLSGIVMVDEIDLLLHPKWQMKVIKTIAKALPRMQFIFTSHSPLVASSLEWMNINLLRINEKTNKTVVKRLKESIHGLDADQVLISSFFGLRTTRRVGSGSNSRTG